MIEIEAGPKLDALVAQNMGFQVVALEWPCYRDMDSSHYEPEVYQDAPGTLLPVYIDKSSYFLKQFEDGSYGYEDEDGTREISWPPQPDKAGSDHLSAIDIEAVLPYSTEWTYTRYVIAYAVKRGYSFHCDIESETAVTVWFNKGANFRGRYEDSATGYGTSLPHAAALAFINIAEFQLQPLETASAGEEA